MKNTIIASLITSIVCLSLIISAAFVILHYNTVIISTSNQDKNFIQKMVKKYVPVYNEGTYVCILSRDEKKEHFNGNSFLTSNELSIGQVYYLTKQEDMKIYRFKHSKLIQQFVSQKKGQVEEPVKKENSDESIEVQSETQEEKEPFYKRMWTSLKKQYMELYTAAKKHFKKDEENEPTEKVEEIEGVNEGVSV